MPSRPLAALVAVAAAAASVVAQPPPMGRGEGPPTTTSGAGIGPGRRVVDEGVQPQLFEDRNVERFLDKARDFLARGEFGGAIDALQAILEGRIGDDGGSERTTTSPASLVHTLDGRRYRPVWAVCQEVLAALPPEGRTLYRTRYEIEASRALDTAAANGDVDAIAAVAARWFPTVAGGRATKLAADLRFDAGAFAAAANGYSLLTSMHPQELRTEVADAAFVALRLAICHAALGDAASADAALVPLTSGGASITVAGERRPAEALRDLVATVSGAPRAIAPPPPNALPRLPGSLVPTHEHRFAAPGAYQGARASAGRSRPTSGTDAVLPMVAQLQPGVVPTFVDDEWYVLDHCRLRVFDRIGGRLLRESDGALEFPEPEPGRARARVPIFDIATSMPVVGRDVVFVVRGTDDERVVGTIDAVLVNELVAFDRATLATNWTSRTTCAPPGSGTTFLAAPTIAADVLVVPVLENGVFGVLGIDARTGARRFLTALHHGGTETSRPPTVPCTLADGTAFVLTNAGVAAAVDAHTGELRWLRRYERLHPFRDDQRLPPRNRALRLAGTGMLREVSSLVGFAPVAPIVAGDVVVFAPNDGKVMLGLDGATGEIRWLVSRTAPGAEYVIGADASRLYAAGTHVSCIELRTGRRLWQEPMPSPGWHGRGAVAADGLVVPGQRTLHRMPFAEPRRWQSFSLDEPSTGRQALQGPCNVHLDGAAVVLVFENGVETHVDADRLIDELAQRPARVRAEAFAVVGRPGDGAAVLHEALAATAVSEREAADVALWIAFARDAAVAQARAGAASVALAEIDRIAPLLDDADAKRRLVLARADVLRAAGDLDGASRELLRLRALESGR